MKKLFTALAMLLLAGGAVSAQQLKPVVRTSQSASYWQSIDPAQAPSQSVMSMHPSKYLVYALNEMPLRLQMETLPGDPDQYMIVSLPMGNGTMRDFKVWQTPMMPDELAVKYPDIKTFTGEAVDDHRVTVKLDFTLFGFHSMVFEPGNTTLIDPYDHFHDGYYIVHYKRDEVRLPQNRMKCGVKSDEELSPVSKGMGTLGNGLPKLNLTKKTFDAVPHTAARVANGWQLRSYRIALSADNFYCVAATGLPTPTIAQALSAMTTTMNRVNGVYNREFSVQMNFVANEDTLIWTAATGTINGADPFNAYDADPTTCLSVNQTTCDNRIGTGNYDVGHVFTTNGGGLAAVGIVCNASSKAQGVTGSSTPTGDGFDIDYVAHELGHEFGSSHTFNNNVDGSCGGNASSANAYEPGSGATIMDYAGICSPDDLQMHSDPYFSGSSMKQITAKLAGSEEACAVHAATGNKLAYVPSFTPAAAYNIPYKTPFELIGPTAVDSVADTATTYCWFEWDLGDFGLRLNQTFVNGPIFRSFQPVYTPTRVFPKVSMVLAGTLSDVGTEGAEGEKAPDTARSLRFKLAVRTILAGNGCVNIPDDSISVNAIQTGSAYGYQGFKVTSQGTTGIVYTGGSSQTVTWNVVGTNASPVSAANVDIYMSEDGGYTWPDFIGTFPNTGTASVTIPNPAASTSTARIKVKGNGNIFFNVNSRNFTVNTGAATGPVTGTFTVCVGNTTTLADATTGGTWASGTTSVATVGSSTGIVTGVAAGTATISYIAVTGTVTQVVTVNAAPSAGTITGGGTTVCTGQTITLADATTGGTWTSANPSGATVDPSSGVVSGVSAGAVVISYSVTNGCGTAVATVNVTVSTPPTVAAITGANNVCAGSSITLNDATTGGAWSSSTPGVATIVASGTNGVVTGVSAGTAIISYTVTGACANSSISVVTVNALPTVFTTPSGTAELCTGGDVLLTASASPGVTYQWQNGTTNITGATNAAYNVTATGNYRVVVTNTNGCKATSAVVAVIPASSSTLTPAVSILASPGFTLCATAGAVTFTANPVNGGGAPAYQWSVNGSVAGTSNTYTYAPANGDVVSVQLTSSLGCASTATATTTDTMVIEALQTPTVAVTASPNDTICAGSSVTYGTVSTFGGTDPTYLWTQNGTNVATGPYYITVPADGDTIVCTMTSNYGCLATPVAVSVPFIIHVMPASVNSITISVAGTTVAAGAEATFTATASNGGTSPEYQWYINGSAVAGATSSTYVTDSLQNGQIVTCSVASSVLCAGPHTAMSSGVMMTVVTTGVPQVGYNSSSFALHPNPNNGSFLISGHLGTAAGNIADINVYNMLGQVIYTGKAHARNAAINERIVLPDVLPSGVYMVNVSTGDTHVVFHMVVE